MLIALHEATGGVNWKTPWWTNGAEKYRMRVRGHSRWLGVETDRARRVTGLDLTDNGLSGPISAELGRLDQLKSLRLGGNALSGEIPAELGDLANLECLELNDNQLSGTIPPALGKLTHLKELKLDGNQLSDSIPPEPVPSQPSPNPPNVIGSGSRPDTPSEVKPHGRLQALATELGIELDPKLERDATEWALVAIGVAHLLLDRRVETLARDNRTHDFLEQYARLVRTLEERVKTLGDHVKGQHIVALSVDKLQDELAVIEKTLADVKRQIDEETRQRAEVETRNAELQARKSALDEKTASLGEIRDDLQRQLELRSSLQAVIDELETVLEEPTDDADYALRVHETGQAFGASVERFLNTERKTLDIMRRIAEVLRLHHTDDAEILDALKAYDEYPQDLGTAIKHVDEIANYLGELDRCLKTLTEARPDARGEET